MFLNIKEMEVRRIRFDETFEPGQIDFSDTGLRQIIRHSCGRVGQGFWKIPAARCEFRAGSRATMEADCDRCLAAPRFRWIRVSICFIVRRRESDADEIKIDEGEAEIGFYEGLGLELADVIKEQVLLAMPMQRVCREDCKGICPVCGANRNEVCLRLPRSSRRTIAGQRSEEFITMDRYRSYERS